jgi:hypothetical protein
MAKKVSKNQRTTRGAGADQKNMAKVIVAAKKQNGNYEFRQKMVETSRVQEEISSLRG